MFQPTRVKICGITRLEDARCAVSGGADLIGFVFAPSPRRLNPAQAAGFWSRLPAGTPRVGVFKDQPAGEIDDILSMIDLDYLQFHGAESPEFCRRFGRPVIKAFSLRRERDLRLMEAYRGSAEIFLVDLPKTADEGAVIPSDLAGAAASFGRPVLIAGGLNPANVGDLVRNLRPYGVDVARGVERSPGIKDAGRVRSFVASVRAAEHRPPPAADESTTIQTRRRTR